MQKMRFLQFAQGYDVVIVGVGAAGCFLASNLSDNFRVLLIDYKLLPKRKACSGILTRQSIEVVKELDPPDEIFHDPLYLDIKYVDWEHGLEKLSKKGFLNSDRHKLDYWLLSRAKDKPNVHVFDKTKLVDFKYTDNKKFIVVILEHEGQIKSIVTKYLVGCDGANSIIRKKIFNKDIPYYIAVQEVIPGKKPDQAYFIFDDSITDYYSWIIPKNGGAEVGAALKPFKPMENFNLFKQKVAEKYGIKGKGSIESALMLRPRSLNDICLGKDNILLCGEAAALISPSSAEGISYALRSAKFCANALNKGKNPFEEYKKGCKVLLDRLDQKFKKAHRMSAKETRIELMKE